MAPQVGIERHGATPATAILWETEARWQDRAQLEAAQPDLPARPDGADLDERAARQVGAEGDAPVGAAHREHVDGLGHERGDRDPAVGGEAPVEGAVEHHTRSPQRPDRRAAPLGAERVERVEVTHLASPFLPQAPSRLATASPAAPPRASSARA